MAKFLVIQDFEVAYQVIPNGVSQAVVFPKGNVVEAAKSPFDGKIVTTTAGTMPNFDKAGEVFIPLVMDKVKLIEEPQNVDTKKWLYLGGAAILLWWFIYGRENKPKYSNEAAGYF